MGAQGGKKTLVPEPGPHVFPNQAGLARRGTVAFSVDVIRGNSFLCVCLLAITVVGGFFFSFVEFCVCVLNLNCSKKICVVFGPLQSMFSELDAFSQRISLKTPVRLKIDQELTVSSLFGI